MRILLAEDERSLSRAVSALLKRNCYEVDAVYDGTEALNNLQNAEYDGVILDIMMPGMDGIAVLKAFRQHNTATPVLLLTAKSEIKDKVLGLDSGANDYLTKPFAPQELLARLRAMTRGKSMESSTILHMGNIQLNRTTFELSSPSGSFRLTNKEYQMMEMLMMNQRQLIPTERLMEKIWGYDSEADIHVVWVYISYLRKKLTTLKADIQIKVSRNAGYLLEEIA